MSFYAVHRGHKNGVFDKWEDCKLSINHFSKAIYKKFKTYKEAEHFYKTGKILEETLDCNKEININKNSIDYTDNSIIVYTDGACCNNGTPQARAGMGVYFGENDPRNVSRRVEGKQTNNVGELGAIIEAFTILKKEIDNNVKVVIFSDSKYAIRCCGEYGEKCEKQGWKKEMPNRELVRQAYEMFKGRSNVKLVHVKAHTGRQDIHSIGNFHADRLADQSVE